MRPRPLATLALICLTLTTPGQRPSLPDLLHHLQSNLDAYDKSIPSFFANEHILSTMTSENGDTKSVIDSTFRLQRITAPDHTSTLDESRDIHSIDGLPATARTTDLDAPSMLTGVFESGLAIVSLDQSACMRYTLQKPHPSHPTEPYAIRFSTALAGDNTDACLLQEKSTVRILVDPASLQITHLEITTPHHLIIPAHAYSAPVIGKRILSIDYAPIQLDAETVWLPSTITMRAVSGDGTFHKTTWTFTATYTSYHKLKVTHQILPASH